MKDQATYEELQERLALASEALGKAEEKAIAGRLALELMHEIKNPLEALGHLTYLAKAEFDNPEKVKQYMGLAEEQLATVSRITIETLGFAKTAEEPKPFDLVRIAEAALRIHQRTIDSKKIHLVKDLSEALFLPVHNGELLQVVSNLIVNALDALPASGTLCVRLRKRKDKVDLLIADNGCGIPKEHHRRLFEPFFTTKEERGTGLGLALSKKIIERHKGIIRMRSSTRDGRSGTTFRISLPA